jgi:hypothetical protein
VNWVEGTLEIAAGLFFVLGSARFAVWAQKYNPRVLVREAPAVAYRVAFLLVGGVFIMVGVLSILGVIRYT